MKRRKVAKTGGDDRRHDQLSVPMPPRRLANEHDNAVVEQLAIAPLGTLNVDHFAELLTGNPRSDSAASADLRIALIKLYVDAAQFRAESKVPKEKIKSAEAAMDSLWKAAEHLEKVKPRHTRGLQGIFGIPGDDPKGLDELSAFSTRCWATRLEISKLAMALGNEINAEKAKPSAKGERKKRLRILIEALAEWWIRATGKPIAPYVQTKPLGNRRAFVVRRSGRFVEFAVSIFSELDEFEPSEVISAIINVYEQRRRRHPHGRSR